MAQYETLLYEEKDGVAWVTMNRPEVHNAFNARMQHELRALWRGLRRNDDVRVVVLTGAGDRAFSTGIDSPVSVAWMMKRSLAASRRTSPGTMSPAESFTTSPGTSC